MLAQSQHCADSSNGGQTLCSRYSPLKPEPRHKLDGRALSRGRALGRVQAGGLARRAVKHCVVNLTFIASLREKREILWMKHFSCPYRLTCL